MRVRLQLRLALLVPVQPKVLVLQARFAPVSPSSGSARDGAAAADRY